MEGARSRSGGLGFPVLAPGFWFLVLLLCGCSSDPLPVRTLDIRLRQTGSPVEHVDRADTLPTERPQAHLSVRIWRLDEARRKTWLPELQKHFVDGAETGLPAKNGLALLRGNEPLTVKLRGAKTDPGSHARTRLPVGRRLDIVIGPDARPGEVRVAIGDGREKTLVTSDRTLALACSLRSLEDGAANIRIVPALKGKHERVLLPDLAMQLKLAPGESIVVMRHATVAPDLGRFFATTGIVLAKSKGEDAPDGFERREVAQEMCVIVTVDEISDSGSRANP